MTDHRRTVGLLWLTLAASLAASWAHLAQLFARYETPDSWWIGAVAATAVDLGILSAMRAVGELAAAGRPTRQARATVAGLVALSCVANAAHALAMGRPGSVAEAALAVGAAAALPLIVWRLALLLDEVKRPTTQAVAAPLVAMVDAKPRPKRAASPKQTPTTDTRARVLAAAETHPDASARELARQAGTTDGVVRRMEAAGTLRRNGKGWEVR